MVDINYNDYGVAAALNNMAEAQQMQAMRPQKSRVYTNTTSTPRELEDMIVRRNMIGAATRELDDALKAREGYKYSLGTALAGLPQQQGPGSWLSAFARSFGAGMAAPTAAQVDRAQKKYEAEIRDLNTAIALDKAMGETQGQTQTIKYDELPYGLGGGKGGKGNGAGDSFAGVQTSNFGRSVGYDPVENIPDYGPVTRAALSEDQMGVMKYVPGAQSLAKGITDKTATRLQTTWGDISDNILSGRVLDFVGKAGSIRVADTPAEQEFIFGPIRNYQNMTPRQLKQALNQARNNFVTAGLKKAKEAGIDVTEGELKTWWNSGFSVPGGMETDKMYNIQNRQQRQTAQKPASKSKYEVVEVIDE